MKVFSKRYSTREFLRLRRTYGVGPNINRPSTYPRPEILDSSLRMRLSQEIAYIVGTSKYTEPFLLAKYNDEAKYVLDESALQRLSFRELGYDITEYFSAHDLVLNRINTEEGGSYYYDKYLLDLVEILIIFSLDAKREEVVRRFQKIMSEENSNLLLYGYMVVIQDEGGLKSMINLLSDSTLRGKLEDILLKGVESSLAARESADVTQRVFSSPVKRQTKQDTEKIIEDISKRWIVLKDQEDFQKIFNSIVKNIKDINNQISNIRHTDRDRITFGSPDIFKLIRNLNLAISEMAILSTQDDFIEKESASELKQNYLQDYSIENKISIFFHNPGEEPVNLDDIPF
ncbi:hypothetical protein EYC59_04015 [Candidatus Saccharibacteria bacterium]|nr:MAG: hypothetical protein EYC59_04015 [Candidatus Saccharibacteria bacterium]